jgi:hypothetical protein
MEITQDTNFNRPPTANELKITITGNNGWDAYYLERHNGLPHTYACRSFTDWQVRNTLSPHRHKRMILTTLDGSGLGDHESITNLTDATEEDGYTPILRFTAQLGQRVFELLRHKGQDQAIPYLLREITPSP